MDSSGVVLGVGASVSTGTVSVEASGAVPTDAVSTVADMAVAPTDIVRLTPTAIANVAHALGRDCGARQVPNAVVGWFDQPSTRAFAAA